jgi:hypothetical protein
MAWVKLDDSFPEHTKIIAAGGDAAWLHVCALAYANRNLTDGHIPAGVLHRLSDRRQPARLAARLVDCGMWHVADDGWQIHDFLTYQTSREKVLEQREEARVRMAKARGGSVDVRPNKQRSSPNPIPSPPDLSLSSSSPSDSGRHLAPVLDDDDDGFIERTIEHIVSIRMQEHRPRNPLAWKRTVTADIRATHYATLVQLHRDWPTFGPDTLAQDFCARPELHLGGIA